MNKPCDRCGKMMKIAPSRLKAGRGKYCSKHCFDEAQTGLWHDGQCAHCSVGFRYSDNQKRHHGERIYCSDACHRAAQREKATGPYAFAGGTLEHRYLMEQHLGYKLKRHQEVHHINEDKRDNRIENLEVLSTTEHRKLHGYRPRKPKPGPAVVNA